MKIKVLILLFGLPLLFSFGCNNQKSYGTDEYYSQEDGYKDGIYCAEVKYYNPSTGTRNTYDLDVEVGDDELTVIHWPNGGWWMAHTFALKKSLTVDVNLDLTRVIAIP